jgi:hypothetical protein
MQSPDEMWSGAEMRSPGDIPDEDMVVIEEAAAVRDTGSGPQAESGDADALRPAESGNARGLPPEAFGDAGAAAAAADRNAGVAPPAESGNAGPAPQAEAGTAGVAPPAESGNAGAAAQPTGTERRWSEIQAMFVDDPRGSVQQAADLIDTAIEELVSSVRQRQTSLASSWQDSDAGTEKLRGALRDYRAFWGTVRDMPAPGLGDAQAGRVTGAGTGRASADQAGPGRAPGQAGQHASQVPGSGRYTQSPPPAR